VPRLNALARTLINYLFLTISLSNFSLPPIVLLHGLSDTTVPYQQSTKFAQALSEASSDVTVRLLPDCGHKDICLDLMDSKRRFHKPVMDIVAETAKRVF
jgi:dipeptidyl aminopeptidase/acylaminoacyl peptidase